MIFALFALGGFILGYLFGRLDEIIRLLKSPESSSFVAGIAREQKASPRRRVEIDEKKFVVDISTEGMESRGEQKLGDVVKSNDDISAASNKLAQLKKMKS